MIRLSLLQLMWIVFVSGAFMYPHVSFAANSEYDTHVVVCKQNRQLELGTEESGSNHTDRIFSMRTRKVGLDQLTKYERATLSTTLKFIKSECMEFATDPDCIVHNDGSVTCLKEGEWICWCDPPDSGTECGCAEF